MKSLEELKAIRDKAKGGLAVRDETDAQTKIVVGCYKNCCRYGNLRYRSRRTPCTQRIFR